MCVSLVLRSISADLIDVSEHADGAFGLKQRRQFTMTGVSWRGDANERDVSGTGTTGIIDGVADIQQLLAGAHGRDLEQAVWRGFFTSHVIRGHQQEAVPPAFALERDLSFPGIAAGE